MHARLYFLFFFNLFFCTFISFLKYFISHFIYCFLENECHKSSHKIFQICTSLSLSKHWFVILSLALFVYFIFHFLPIKETRSSYREDTFLKLAAVSNLGDINGIIMRRWIALALTKLAIMREVYAFIFMRYASETVVSRSFLLQDAY